MRNYKKKTNRGNISKEKMLAAAKEIIEDKKHLRPVADKYNINFATLQRYVKKCEKVGLEAADTIQTGYVKNRQIFSDAQENELATYVTVYSKIYPDFSSKDLKRFAYEYAQKNNVSVPENWTKSECASNDWLSGFLKRHNTLSIRSSRATSSECTTSFNPVDVNVFLEKLSEAYERCWFGGIDNVYNPAEAVVQELFKSSSSKCQQGNNNQNVRRNRHS